MQQLRTYSTKQKGDQKVATRFCQFMVHSKTVPAASDEDPCRYSDPVY